MTIKRKIRGSELRDYGRSGAGRLMPYTMIIVFGIILLFTPINVDKYTLYEGELVKYNYTETSLFIYVDIGSKEPQRIKVDIKTYRNLLRLILPEIKYVKVWSKSRYSDMRQLEADGQMIIPYSWWVHTRLAWCFVLFGLILIPFTERSYKKWRQSEKQKKLKEEQQEKEIDHFTYI